MTFQALLRSRSGSWNDSRVTNKANSRSPAAETLLFRKVGRIGNKLLADLHVTHPAYGFLRFSILIGLDPVELLIVLIQDVRNRALVLRRDGRPGGAAGAIARAAGRHVPGDDRGRQAADA